MHKYRLVAKKGEGTFSEVLKAQCIKNGKYVAIKCMKNHFDSLDQVNNLREIQALRRLSPHANIIKLLEVLYDQPTGRLALVFELMDMNIYELIRGRRHYVAEDRVKNYMYQLMKAMDHMHRNGIFHRDIKPENILIMDDCLKLADFGSCRGIYSKQPYTEYISTRWYRAPECLLTDGYYNYKMDMWGVGCVFFEIMSLFPLFPGTNELDQIQKIHNILGTPPPELLAKMKKRSQHMDFNFPAKEGTGIAKLIPHVSPDCVDLIVKLLAYNPDDRVSARQALRHPYFKELRDADKRQKALMNPDLTGGLSAQPSAASQGHLAGHAGMQAAAAEESKSARHPTASAAGSEDITAMSHHTGHAGHGHTNTHASAVNNLQSPPESSRVSEHPALPSIGKMPLAHNYVHHQPHQQPHSHTHSHTTHMAAHAHTLPVGSGAGMGGGFGHHIIGGATVAGHELGLGHHHRAGLGDPGDDGPLEISNSYRLQGLHAEGSMGAMSQIDNEGGALPPIGNLSLGKAHAQRRAIPNYYDPGHGAQSGNYSKSKAGMVKRQGVPPAKYSSKPSVGVSGLGSSMVGPTAVAGHKLAPAGVTDLGAAGGQPSYKYKAGGSKNVAKYISPYSLRHLVGVGKE